MKPAKLPAPQPTIRFSAKLEEAPLTLPKARAAERRGPVALARQRKIALTLRTCLGLG